MNNKESTEEIREASQDSIGVPESVSPSEPTSETWEVAGKIAAIAKLGLCEEKTLLTRAIAHALTASNNSEDSIEVPENQNASGEMRAKAPSLSTTAIPKDSSLSADPPVSERTRLIREQQRSGASEVSAVMVSPLEKVASVTEFFERHSEASAVMLTRHTQAETALAFKVLKESLQLDSNYAWSWHCNIAMVFYDEARRLDEGPIQISALHEVANNAAARFMGLCFEIDVTKSSEWASHDENVRRHSLIERHRTQLAAAEARVRELETCESCQRPATVHACHAHAMDG